MKWLYYLIQLTWGILMTLIGAIAYFIFAICLKYPTSKYRNMYCFVMPYSFGGMNLGMFAVYGEGDESVLSHEYGHSIQNLFFGPLMPFIIGIPSVIRYWYRELQYTFKKPPTTNYDDIWFEGQATSLGKKADSKKWKWI